MTLEIQDTVSLDDANVRDELKELIPSLLKEDVRVFYSPERGARKSSFVYLERGGNVAVLEYRDYTPFGYAVSFPIKPNKETGSGIGVINYDDPDKESTTWDIQEALEACEKALQSELKHWFDGKTYPNYGHNDFFCPVIEITES